MAARDEIAITIEETTEFIGAVACDLQHNDTVGVRCCMGAADGSFEDFTIGVDNLNRWSGWRDLGNPVESSGGPGDYLGVELGANKDGRVELFVSGRGRLWRRSQTAPASNSWSNWAGMGRPAANTALLEPVEAERNGDGRQEVFVIGARGSRPSTVCRCWHRWQTAANGGWGPWAGFSAPQARSPESLVSASNADGRLAVFAVTSEDRSVWMISQET